jgi:hypothetical protein
MAGNENRAHIEKSGIENRMTPTTTLPRPPSPGEIVGPGLCSANPLLDAHSKGRHSFDNMTTKPGEASRAQRSAETRRRIEDRTPTYKY